MQQNELDTIVEAGSIILKRLVENIKTEAEIARDAIFGGSVNAAANRAADAADRAEQAEKAEQAEAAQQASEAAASPAHQPAISKEFVRELQDILLKNHITLTAMPNQKGAVMLDEIMRLIEKYEG